MRALVSVYFLTVTLTSGCAVNTLPEESIPITAEDPFGEIDEADTRPVSYPLPRFVKPDERCAELVLPGDGSAFGGELLATEFVISPADSNGFRDSVSLSLSDEVTTTELKGLDVLKLPDCRSLGMLALNDEQTAEWNGELNGQLVDPGTYLLQAVSEDGNRRGPVVSLLVLEKDHACDLPGTPIEWVFDASVSQRDAGKSVFVNRDESLELCIEAKTSQGERQLPEIRVNDVVYVTRQDTRNHSAIAFGTTSHAARHSVTLDKLIGDVDLRIGVIPATAPPVRAIGDDSALESDRWQTCTGRLFSFSHPFRPGPRRQVLRSGVAVDCWATYEFERQVKRYDYDRQEMVPTIVTVPVQIYASGVTDEMGRFAITIPDSEFQRIGVSPYDRPAQIGVRCHSSEQCGREVRWAGTRLDNGELYFGLFNVVDIAINGLAARLITNGNVAQDALNVPTELVDPDLGWAAPGDPNDLPLVIHEAFDPLLEDGTRRLAWFLNGQIVDHERLDGEGLANSPCDEPIKGPCEYCRWNLQCDAQRVQALTDPAIRSDDRFRCHAPNVLLQMLGGGYDVWLVDSVRSDASTYEIAAGAIDLYQEILDYNGPDEDRQLALAGLSLGGVTSRIALRSWEVLQSRKESGDNSPIVFEVEESESDDSVSLVETPRPFTLRHSPESVALFLSFDSPHLGARLPLTFQAYVKDKDFRGGPRFPALLGSTPARELLDEFIHQGTDTVCWGTNDDKVKDCTLKFPIDSNESLQKTQESRSQILVSKSIDFFASQPPGLPEPVGLTTGLPRTIPSVALANGSLEQNPAQVSDTVLDVDFDLLTTEFTHVIKDSPRQPLGSGLDTFCSAKESEEEEILVSVAALIYADCRDNTAGFLGNIVNRVVCGVVSVASVVGSIGNTRFEDAGISADISIPMRPLGPGTGAYPTFIETRSALLVRPRLQLHNVPWVDYSTRPVSQSHFSIDDEQCRFVMYHLDGHMKGDRDGWPACTGRASNSCLSGGRQPGQKIDDDGIWADAPESFCDPNDNNTNIIPLKLKLDELRKLDSLKFVD